MCRLMDHVADWFLVAQKILRSFFTRDWALEDYPVRVEYFPDVLKRSVFDGVPLQAELHPNVIDRQLRDPPWSGTWLAYVINWPEMGRFGDSSDETLANLREDFAEWKAAGESLPRPGTSVAIPYAPAHRIAEHPDLAADFLQRIFNLDHRACWLSDLADLSCLHREATNDRYVEQVLLTYGVDITDIAGGPLVDIFERIVTAGGWSGSR